MSECVECVCTKRRSSNRNAFGCLTHSPKSEIVRRLCTVYALLVHCCCCFCCCVFLCFAVVLLSLFLSFSFVVVSPVQRMCNMQCKTIRCKLDSRTVPVIGRQLCVITFDTLSSACVGGEVISVVYRLRFTAFLNTHTLVECKHTRTKRDMYSIQTAG